ncbi:hypothetical protein MJO52_20275 [Microbulbifer variabilis]|uniref:Uncharacterized protein n=1 Tax=Microbulbifer variabilis TaxID=266805 RepID=A0ABY4VAQ1_9GAMM|nr:hypothetical protein [Microbulbifer variabilis]USD21364.1 hypothetical protein MJO52_20275 [Microbulbifer variabilis]
MADDSMIIQSLATFYSEYKVKGLITSPCNLNNSNIKVFKSVDIKCIDDRKLLNGSLIAKESVGADTAITNNVFKGFSVIDAHGSELIPGDMIFIRGILTVYQQMLGKISWEILQQEIILQSF